MTTVTDGPRPAPGNWKTLRLLAWHEGNLLVSRASLRVKGGLCGDAEHALIMAALVVTDEDVDGVVLSPYAADAMNAIHRTACEISEPAWLSALQWSREHHAQVRADDRRAAAGLLAFTLTDRLRPDLLEN
ncbi:hypothetical protein [Erwinia amylovora]|uniref:hypothetical protein n=1 Tax=Erwinia amylovora TaxID=552 RepID=UPI0011774192|nr:hypothetical protein [Erwinia amylovora]